MGNGSYDFGALFFLLRTLSANVNTDDVNFPQLLSDVWSRKATKYQCVAPPPPAADPLCF